MPAIKITVRKNGPYRVEAPEGSVELVDADGKVYAVAGILTDITDRVRLEAEVLQAGEEEQRRIARDLHDGLGQHLTGLIHLAAVLQSSLAERSLPEAAEASH